jgi:ATP-dependent RNA helicase RhlE
LPEVAEHYVHRIGRTGRAGNEGLAVSLVAPDERPLLKQIERLLGAAVEIRRPDGYVPAAQPRRDDQRPQGGSPQAANGQARHAHRGQRPEQGRRHGGRNHRHGGRSSQRAQRRGR